SRFRGLRRHVAPTSVIASTRPIHPPGHRRHGPDTTSATPPNPSAMSSPARWLKTMLAPIGLPPPGYVVPLTAAIELPAAYRPAIGAPLGSNTRAAASVRNPPLVPRSDTPKAAAWNGPCSRGTNGDSPVAKNRS